MSKEVSFQCPVDGDPCRSAYMCNKGCTRLKKMRKEDTTAKYTGGMHDTCLNMEIEIEAMRRYRAALRARSGNITVIEEDEDMAETDEKLITPEDEKIVEKIGKKVKKQVEASKGLGALGWLKDHPSKDGRGHSLSTIVDATDLDYSLIWKTLKQAMEAGDVVKISHGHYENQWNVRTVAKEEKKPKAKKGKKAPAEASPKPDAEGFYTQGPTKVEAAPTKIDINLKERELRILEACVGLSEHQAHSLLDHAKLSLHLCALLQLPPNMKDILANVEKVSLEAVKRMNGTQDMMHC